MQDIYLTFEFSRILDAISEFSKTEKGREDILSLRMLEDKDVIANSLTELEEMMSLIQRYSYLPISLSANMINIIELAKKTALLTPRDLSLVREDILTSEKVISYFKKVDSSFSHIISYVERFYDLSTLEKEIKRVITPSLTVSDNATPELKEIRNKLKVLEASLNQKVASLSITYSQYLSDNNVTIREGHFVLPVKTINKNKVLGITYDVSSSGNTTFIEPLEIVNINNEIVSLKIRENEEVRKILKALTNLVLLQEEEVRTNNEIIAFLDFVSAKALYALNNDMKIAKASKENEIHLYQARHPLIDRKKVVSNDYHLSEDKRIVIISGPNAGGKTVSIKVVGLLVLMHQAGLAIPVNEAEIGYFKHIYIDIGDNQSLSDNLSTFSAHMSQISEIMDVVNKNDLVLLDELGTGTDPLEGEAIALACIKYLEAKGPLALISSHFSSIKEYAFLNESIENSSLLFDEEKLLPTYIYKYSVPGKSYGVEVAKRYGLKEEIILEAKRLLKEKDKNNVSELLLILQRKVDENEKLTRELERQQDLLSKKEKELQNKEETIKNQKEHLLEEVKKEKEQIIENAKDEINQIIKELSNPELKLHEVVELKKKIEELEDDVDIISFNEEIKVNDYIEIPSLGIDGRVVRINGKKAHVTGSDGLTFDIDISRLHKIENCNKNTKIKKENYEDRINTSIPLELNIIGLRRAEAEEELVKYLDACILRRYKQVRIIHGFGSGTLRNMVHEKLKKMKNVTFRLGDMYEGGGGATVVIFHD